MESWSRCRTRRLHPLLRPPLPAGRRSGRLPVLPGPQGTDVLIPPLPAAVDRLQGEEAGHGRSSRVARRTATLAADDGHPVSHQPQAQQLLSSGSGSRQTPSSLGQRVARLPLPLPGTPVDGLRLAVPHGVRDGFPRQLGSFVRPWSGTATAWRRRQRVTLHATPLISRVARARSSNPARSPPAARTIKNSTRATCLRAWRNELLTSSANSGFCRPLPVRRGQLFPSALARYVAPTSSWP